MHRIRRFLDPEIQSHIITQQLLFLFSVLDELILREGGRSPTTSGPW